MAGYLCLTFRLLDERYHGTRDGGGPEWPPSPLRAYQALVCAAARRNGGTLPEAEERAFLWLEEQPPPSVVAPARRADRDGGYRLSVPNNSLDVVGRAWVNGNESNGGDASPATHRTMKPVRPVVLSGDAVHFLWRMNGGGGAEARILCRCAKDVAALGWGIDLAIGHGAVIGEGDAEALPGERWSPRGEEVEAGLRIPAPGTLTALQDRHRAFVRRTSTETLDPPAPLGAYRTVAYRRPGDPRRRPWAAFSLLQVEGERFRSFDAAREGLTVAGMLKSATKRAAERSGWPEAKVATGVLGHGEARGADAHTTVDSRRFAYVPLPSLEKRGDTGRRVAGRIRRALIAVYGDGLEAEAGWARRALSGQELIAEGGRNEALLSLIPGSDPMVQQYVRPAKEWATVTPVVLPGFDDPRHYRRRIEKGVDAAEQRELLDRLEKRVDGLVRRAIAQAGFPDELAASAELDWSKAGFWPGSNHADAYGVPDHLKRYPRFHVRLRWPTEVPGPVCVGGGRFYGLGLFAAV